jgi:hypothetical protein
MAGHASRAAGCLRSHCACSSCQPQAPSCFYNAIKIGKIYAAWMQRQLDSLCATTGEAGGQAALAAPPPRAVPLPRATLSLNIFAGETLAQWLALSGWLRPLGCWGCQQLPGSPGQATRSWQLGHLRPPGCPGCQSQSGSPAHHSSPGGPAASKGGWEATEWHTDRSLGHAF